MYQANNKRPLSPKWAIHAQQVRGAFVFDHYKTYTCYTTKHHPDTKAPYQNTHANKNTSSTIYLQRLSAGHLLHRVSAGDLWRFAICRVDMCNNVGRSYVAAKGPVRPVTREGYQGIQRGRRRPWRGSGRALRRSLCGFRQHTRPCTNRGSCASF